MINNTNNTSIVVFENNETKAVNSFGGAALVNAILQETKEAFLKIHKDGEVLVDLQEVLTPPEVAIVSSFMQAAWNTKSPLVRDRPQTSRIEKLLYGGNRIVICLQNFVKQVLQLIPSKVWNRIPLTNGRLAHPKHKEMVEKVLQHLLNHERRHTAQVGKWELELEMLRFFWIARRRAVRVDEYYSFGHEADAEGFAIASTANPDLCSQVDTWERRALPA